MGWGFLGSSSRGCQIQKKESAFKSGGVGIRATKRQVGTSVDYYNYLRKEIFAKGMCQRLAKEEAHGKTLKETVRDKGSRKQCQ